MMHPFANVGGLFDEDLESWQGQFGCSIESFEFYETDETRGFVRGAKWGLAPTFGPINAALPSRAGTQVWGPDHHLHVNAHLGRGANWGLFGEDLPDESNQVLLSPTLTDTDGIPAPEIRYQVSENSRRLLDFHIEKASQSLLEAGAYKVEVDRLIRGLSNKELLNLLTRRLWNSLWWVNPARWRIRRSDTQVMPALATASRGDRSEYEPLGGSVS